MPSWPYNILNLTMIITAWLEQMMSGGVCVCEKDNRKDDK